MADPILIIKHSTDTETRPLSASFHSQASEEDHLKIVRTLLRFIIKFQYFFFFKCDTIRAQISASKTFNQNFLFFGTPEKVNLRTQKEWNGAG